MDIVAYLLSMFLLGAVACLFNHLLKLQKEVDLLRSSLKVTSDNVEEISLSLAEWE